MPVGLFVMDTSGLSADLFSGFTKLRDKLYLCL